MINHSVIEKKAKELGYTISWCPRTWVFSKYDEQNNLITLQVEHDGSVEKSFNLDFAETITKDEITLINLILLSKSSRRNI